MSTDDTYHYFFLLSGLSNIHPRQQNMTHLHNCGHWHHLEGQHCIHTNIQYIVCVCVCVCVCVPNDWVSRAARCCACILKNICCDCSSSKSPPLWVCKYWWGSKRSPWTVYLFIFLSVHSPSAEFREPRVIELWEAAKRANLTEDELDSLKVPLPSLVTISGHFFFHHFVSS